MSEHSCGVGPSSDYRPTCPDCWVHVQRIAELENGLRSAIDGANNFKKAYELAKDQAVTYHTQLLIKELELQLPENQRILEIRRLEERISAMKLAWITQPSSVAPSSGNLDFAQPGEVAKIRQQLAALESDNAAFSEACALAQEKQAKAEWWAGRLEVLRVLDAKVILEVQEQLAARDAEIARLNHEIEDVTCDGHHHILKERLKARDAEIRALKEKLK